MSARQRSSTKTKSGPSTNGDDPGEYGPGDFGDLKAELDKVLARATKETFDRIILVVARVLLDRGLEESSEACDVAVDALHDKGSQLKMTSRQLAAIANRLAENITGQKNLKDSASGKSETKSGKNPTGLTATELVELAEELFDFSWNEHGLLATPKDGGEPLLSNAFSDQLAAASYEMTDVAPTSAVLQNAMRVLTGKARGAAQPIDDDDFDDIPDESGSALLNDLADFIARFVILPCTECIHALALWVLHTWVISILIISPRLLFRSPTAESGKSLSLEVLSCLCRAPELSILASAPSIYRLTESDQPSWLLDEFDQTMKTNPEAVAAIMAIWNSGYRRSRMTVPKQTKVGDNWVTERFSIFTPMAAAGMLQLSDTSQSRTLVIDMVKKSPDQEVGEFILPFVDIDPETVMLRRRCAAWAQRHGDDLASVLRPPLPPVLGDRAKECWSTLKAIAVLAGGQWPRRADRAAIELSGPGHDRGALSDGMTLLADLRQLWFTKWCDRRKLNGEEERTPWRAVPTKAILYALERLEESGWKLYSRVENGRGSITDKDLADLLRPFNVRSKKIRFTTAELGRFKDLMGDAADDVGLVVPDKGEPSTTVRGYYLDHVQPEWDRHFLDAFQEEGIGDGEESS
jgi:hypothetical protein